MKQSEKTMEKIVNLCKGRGFIFAGSEIYGGLANTWDYGPLGVELKNNVKRAWWKKFVQENRYNVGLDSAILMNPQTWVASGHLKGFSDPLMDCRECNERFRADKIIEDWCHETGFQLGILPAVAGLGALGEVLNELVGAETGLTGLAVHQRIVEAADVAGSYPNLTVHQDRAVQTGVVGAFLHELLPPGLLDVVLELNAQRTVVPGVGQAAVDLGACEDEAAALAQGDQLVHGRYCHDFFLPEES